MENSEMSNVYKSVGRYNSVPTERPFNPLYDGRSGGNADVGYTRLLLIPIVFIVTFAYLKMQKKEVIGVPTTDPTIAERTRKNRIIFNEDLDTIGQLGVFNDPHVYNNFDDSLGQNSARTLTNSPALMASNAERRARFNRNKPVLSAVLNGIDSMGQKLVFVGSFANKENAEKLLRCLKSMGYDKSEIVMKEKLPYKVVVTGLNNPDKNVKNQVQALQKRGIDVYSAVKNLEEIYRQSQK